MMSRQQVCIPGTQIWLSVPEAWDTGSDEAGYLIVTRPDMPRFRLSFSLRTLPNRIPAHAFILDEAKKAGERVYEVGDKWYVFGRDDGQYAPENTHGFWWKVGFTSHLVGIFGEVPDTCFTEALLDGLVREMADVIESLHEA